MAMDKNIWEELRKDTKEKRKTYTNEQTEITKQLLKKIVGKEKNPKKVLEILQNKLDAVESIKDEKWQEKLDYSLDNLIKGLEHGVLPRSITRRLTAWTNSLRFWVEILS